MLSLFEAECWHCAVALCLLQLRPLSPSQTFDTILVDISGKVC